MKLLLGVAMAMSVGCGAVPPTGLVTTDPGEHPRGLQYVCHLLVCPPDTAVQYTLTLMARDQPYSVGGDLLVDWFAPDAKMPDDEGTALEDDWVTVTSLTELAHAAQHVHFWRTSGDPARKHDGEWTADTDDLLARVYQELDDADLE